MYLSKFVNIIYFICGKKYRYENIKFFYILISGIEQNESCGSGSKHLF